ncbi:MAG: hypothetical protein D6815_02980, partial [Candidatus Dadabacteria bacterium]
LREKGGGKIVVRTAPGPDETVRIEVENDGPPLSAEAASRAFDPFFSTRPGGLGLGLSLSRSIVEAHKGRLELEANKPGLVRFTVKLPAGKGGYDL